MELDTQFQHLCLGMETQAEEAEMSHAEKPFSELVRSIRETCSGDAAEFIVLAETRTAGTAALAAIGQAFNLNLGALLPDATGYAVEFRFRSQETAELRVGSEPAVSYTNLAAFPAALQAAVRAETQRTPGRVITAVLPLPGLPKPLRVLYGAQLDWLAVESEVLPRMPGRQFVAVCYEATSPLSEKSQAALRRQATLLEPLWLWGLLQPGAPLAESFTGSSPPAFWLPPVNPVTSRFEHQTFPLRPANKLGQLLTQLNATRRLHSTARSLCRWHSQHVAHAGMEVQLVNIALQSGQANNAQAGELATRANLLRQKLDEQFNPLKQKVEDWLVAAARPLSPVVTLAHEAVRNLTRADFAETSGHHSISVEITPQKVGEIEDDIRKSMETEVRAECARVREEIRAILSGVVREWTAKVGAVKLNPIRIEEDQIVQRALGQVHFRPRWKGELPKKSALSLLQGGMKFVIPVMLLSGIGLAPLGNSPSPKPPLDAESAHLRWDAGFDHMDKIIVDTKPAGDGSAMFNPGAIIRYRVSHTIPEGDPTNVTVTDELPTGLTFCNDGKATAALVVSAAPLIRSGTLTGLGLSITGNASSPAFVKPGFVLPSAAITNAAGSGQVFSDGQAVSFKFGDLENAHHAPDLGVVVIDYDVVVSSTISSFVRAHTKVDNIRIYCKILSACMLAFGIWHSFHTWPEIEHEAVQKQLEKAEETLRDEVDRATRDGLRETSVRLQAVLTDLRRAVQVQFEDEAKKLAAGLQTSAQEKRTKLEQSKSLHEKELLQHREVSVRLTKTLQEVETHEKQVRQRLADHLRGGHQALI